MEVDAELGQDRLIVDSYGRPLYLPRDCSHRPVGSLACLRSPAAFLASFSPEAMAGHSLFGTAAMISAWYASNIGVLLLNKYLLSVYGFKFPIFLTFLHMLACSFLSYTVSVCGLVPRQYIKSRSQFLKIAALACVFALSVVLGNISLKYIPVSFNQAIGATTPVFTAFFSVTLLGQREEPLTYAALVPVVGGIILASSAEPSFVLRGFIACVSATAARAFKSVLQSLLLTSENERMNSMNLLMYMAPIAALVLLPPAVAMESSAFRRAGELSELHDGFSLMLGLNMATSFLVNLTNFLVTKSTSALTLQVLGNAKGAVAVVVSVMLFKNPVTANGMIGYTITVCGVVGYGEAKKYAKRRLQRQSRMDVESGEGGSTK